MRIPDYTKSLVLNRPVANEVNLGQIEAAGATARGVAQGFDIGAEVALQIKKTNDLTAVNEAVIRRQKEDIDFRQAKQKEWQNNPIGYAQALEPEYAARDKAIMDSLPSEEAKQAYKSTADQLNLRNYESDLNWENKRSTEMFANKAEKSIQDLELMAYRGAPLEEINKNRAATTYSLGGVLAQDELVKFDRKAQERITSARIEGLIDTNPYEAKKALDSREYDSALGVDKLNSLTDRAEAQIESLQRKQQAAQAEYRKLFIEDPAELAVRAGARTPEQIIAKQKEMGVRDGNISLIPKQQAALVVNDFAGAKNSDEFIAQINKLQETVGADNFDMAMNDLAKAKLPSEIKLMALMNPNQDKRLMDAIFAMSKDGENITKRANSRPNISPAKINEAISDLLNEKLEVIAAENPNGMAETSNMMQTMSSIATYYVAQGRTIEEAAEMATGWFNNKIVTGEINNKNFRVPSITTPNEIESALEDAIEQTNFSNIKFEDAFNKKTVRPALHPDEKRYYLLNDIGLPVEDSKGVIYFDIMDIINKRKERLKRIQQKESVESFSLGD